MTSPMRDTATRLDAVHEWLTVTAGDAVPEGWLRCSDVDAAVIADWEHRAARAQVRAHADDFLATYRPGARLPRRDLLGAFFDGLDTGFWSDASSGPMLVDSVAIARTVVPGGTPEFVDPSSLYVIEDATGTPHLTRCRVSCCNFYRVSQDGEACTTCPRTTHDERRRRVLEPAE